MAKVVVKFFLLKLKIPITTEAFPFKGSFTQVLGWFWAILLFRFKVQDGLSYFYFHRFPNNKQSLDAREQGLLLVKIIFDLTWLFKKRILPKERENQVYQKQLGGENS